MYRLKDTKSSVHSSGSIISFFMPAYKPPNPVSRYRQDDTRAWGARSLTSRAYERRRR